MSGNDPEDAAQRGFGGLGRRCLGAHLTRSGLVKWARCCGQL
jgi:hypothetical protein